ncbi:MAG: MYG1 family protein [Lentisphaeraceae bacterium]|nr:MYG1 family protein [Lentisphaeraceae bacterium]
MTILGSHSGKFHADDVFAIAALSLLHPDYKILRSRKSEDWAKCDYLVDVGGVYDHANKIYDHHFKNGPTYEDGLPMSSIGLVWKHYGSEICQSPEIAERICWKFIRTLDAHDNGIELTTKADNGFSVGDVSVSSLVAVMNPTDFSKADEVFEQEVNRAREVLKAYIAKAQKWFASKQETVDSIKRANAEGKRYLEVSENCNFMEHLLSTEEGKNILFVMYPNDEKWYARTVSEKLGSFNDRKSFPNEWAGLRDEGFSEIANIPDGVFCHHSCFICGSHSHESTTKLVQQAIQA